MNEEEMIKKPIGIRILRGILIGFGLLLLNLIFVLGPYLGAWGVIIGFVAGGFAFIISGITMILSYLFTIPFAISIPLILADHPIMLVLGGGFIIGAGGLLLSIFLWLSKYLVVGTIKYMSWQVKLVRGDDDE